MEKVKESTDSLSSPNKVYWQGHRKGVGLQKMRSHRRMELSYEVTRKEWVCRRWGLTEEQSCAMRDG